MRGEGWNERAASLAKKAIHWGVFPCKIRGCTGLVYASTEGDSLFSVDENPNPFVHKV